MKRFKFTVLFLGLVFSSLSFGGLDFNIGEKSFKEHLEKQGNYNDASDTKKCNLNCWVKYKKKLNDENQRFSKVRYHTRSQTKKHRVLKEILLNEKDECVLACSE